MQISLGEIQLHLRGSTGRLPGKRCVYLNQHDCVSHRLATRPCMPKELLHTGVPGPQLGSRGQQERWGYSTSEYLIPSSDVDRQSFHCPNSSSEMCFSFLGRISGSGINSMRRPFDLLPLRRKAKQEAAQCTEKAAQLKAKWGFEWKPSCTAPENWSATRQKSTDVWQRVPPVAPRQDVLRCQSSSFIFPVMGKTIYSKIILWWIKWSLNK